MRVYLLSCLVAAVIALGGAFALDYIQENVDSAYSTTGVRI